MIELLRASIAPYYLYIKFVHLLFVMIWTWSTAHAFMYYLVPVFQEWRKNPDSPDAIRMRNWAMERFDAGVIYEHIAFPVILLTGVLLFIAGGWTTEPLWLSLKLSIIVAIMLPLEITDYYLSHFGGNKLHIRLTGNMVRYDAMMYWHWLFLLLATPVIILFALGLIFLANLKPF